MKGTTQHCYIVKSPYLYATVEDLIFLKTRCDDASEIFKKTYDAVDHNQFTTVLPFVGADLPERSQKYLALCGCIQPIVLEFDNCPMRIQEERSKLIAEKFQTPMFVVHSGNKSIHHYIYFAKFADTVDEYKRKCQQFVAYLAKEYPNYFKVREHDKEKHPLVPDYLMFTGNRYARQANGKRDTGKVQIGKILHAVGEAGIKPLEIDAFLAEHKNTYKGSRNGKISMPEQKQPRKATLSFIAMGAEEGFRDNDCYRAACDLKDCGFSKDEVYAKLLEGAGKCNPPFSEMDVRAKVESAWNSDGTYDPIDRTKPYVFIEKTNGNYFHLIDNKLNSASKDVIKDIFKSYNAPFPDPMPVLEFKFDVHDDNQIDLANRIYNLFTPTRYHLMKKNDEVHEPHHDFPMINNLLENLLPEPAEREHFLNWLACAMRTRRKLMTAYVFKGAQGAGKGLLFGYIIRPLFGESQTATVEDEQLKSSFNGFMKNVCFIAFNEVAHDNSGRNALNSKIKSIITDPTITINEKFIRPFVIKNCTNCIFFSNESVPLLVERSDRRFNIVETGGPLTDASWFDAEKVIPMLGDELPRFAQYLWNIDIDISMANKLLKNSIKEKMIDAGLNRFEEFAMRLKNADASWFIDNVDNSLPQWGGEIYENMLASLPEKKIAKDVAVKLFNRLYPDGKASMKTLTTKLRLYHIEDGRDNDPGRTRIYKW